MATTKKSNKSETPKEEIKTPEVTEEVKELVVENAEPMVTIKETPEPELVKEKKEELSQEPVKQDEPAKKEKEVDESATPQEKILHHLEQNKTGDYIKLNGFLKTLYPTVDKVPDVWKQQGENKKLRVLLDSMQQHNMIEIKGNTHSKLGQTYYDGNEPESKIHTLDTVEILAK